MALCEACNVSPHVPSPPLPLLLPVARDGTSQDGPNEGDLVGDDDGAGSRHDITGGYDADDGANTTAKCKEDDHTPSPSKSSEHI